MDYYIEEIGIWRKTDMSYKNGVVPEVQFKAGTKRMLWVYSADNAHFTSIRANFDLKGVQLEAKPEFLFDPLTTSEGKEDQDHASGRALVLRANGQAVCAIRLGQSLPDGFWEALDAGTVPPPAELWQECVACRRRASASVLAREYVICKECNPPLVGWGDKEAEKNWEESLFSHFLTPGGTPIFGKVKGHREGMLWVHDDLGGGRYLPLGNGKYRRALPSKAPGHEQYSIMRLQPGKVELPEEHVVRFKVAGDFPREFPWNNPNVAKEILGRPIIALVSFANNRTPHHWADAFVGKVTREEVPEKGEKELLIWSTYQWGGGARTLPAKEQEGEIDYLVAWDTTSTCIVYRHEARKLHQVWGGWDN